MVHSGSEVESEPLTRSREFPYSFGRYDLKLVTNLVVDSLQDVAEPAKRIEARGFEALYISERKHNPFMQLSEAAPATSRSKLGP